MRHMTNEERQQAIEWFKRRPVMMTGAKRMYDLAVEALEAYVPDMNVGDTISRQAAINEIAKWMLEYGGEKEKRERDALENVANGIKKLPSVQPKRGKWIERRTWSEGYGMGETYGKYWACNQCGREVKGFWNECGKNFCDNCGADMRGE